MNILSDCPIEYVIPLLVTSSMFDSIFKFLDKLIPVPLSMIHDSSLLSSLPLFSSFKISAVTFIYLYVPGSYWTFNNISWKLLIYYFYFSFLPYNYYLVNLMGWKSNYQYCAHFYGNIGNIRWNLFLYWNYMGVSHFWLC